MDEVMGTDTGPEEKNEEIGYNFKDAAAPSTPALDSPTTSPKKKQKKRKPQSKRSSAGPRYRFRSRWGKWVCFTLFLGVCQCVCAVIFLIVLFSLCLYFED